MKKTVPALLAMLLWASPALAESYVTLANVNMRKAPDLQAGKVHTSKRGWLLKGSPAADGAWVAVSDIQTLTGGGLEPVAQSWPQSGGTVYMSADFVMQVPEQGQNVFPSEDAYTPAFDSEGCVGVDGQGKVIHFGPNETQSLHELNFAKVFTKQAAASPTGESIAFTSMVKDKKNPGRYAVNATVSKGGRTFDMAGTLTLVKAAAFDNAEGLFFRNVATGQKAERVNNEVRNGFVSGDLVLSDGEASFTGIITAYFRWSFDWGTQSLGVEHFEWPSRFIKDFQNPYFSGEWK
jgi:hypothetical protein